MVRAELVNYRVRDSRPLSPPEIVQTEVWEKEEGSPNGPNRA